MRQLKRNRAAWEILCLDLLRTRWTEKKRFDEMRANQEGMQKKGAFRVTATGEEEAEAHLAWLFEDKKFDWGSEDALPEGDEVADADD